MLLLMSSVIFMRTYELIFPAKICALVWRTWRCSGTVSVPVGTRLFRAVSQACLFFRCSSRFLVSSSVAWMAERRQSAHTGRAEQWAGWESEVEPEGGCTCFSLAPMQKSSRYMCSCLLHGKRCTRVKRHACLTAVCV